MSTSTGRVIGSLPTGPTEIDTLLPTNARRLRAKDNGRSLASPHSNDPPSFHPPVPPARRKPLVLQSCYFLNVAVLTLSITAVLLIAISTTSPSLAYALPPHTSSTFLPALLAVYALILSLLTFIDFVVAPTKATDKIERIVLAFMGLASTVMGTLIFAVDGLRRREGILTGLMILLVFSSTLLAYGSLSLVERFDERVAWDSEPIDEDDIHGLGPDPGSFKHIFFHCLSSTLSFFSITLPIIIIYSLMGISFAFLTLNVILRAYDASLQPDGQLWAVDPWSTNSPPAIDGIILAGSTRSTVAANRRGRSYNIHLNCQAVLVDPIIASSGKIIPVRTILVEAPQGVTGRINAQWLLQLRRDGKLDTADREVRVCFWDRPGYGFSDNSPTSSTPHIVSALHSALSISGEIARLGASSTTPLSKSGFVLAPTSYGTLISTLFASRYPSLVHSYLYLSPLSPSLYHSTSPIAAYFASHLINSVIPAYFTQFSYPRLMTTMQRSSSRESRVLSSEDDGVRGDIMRSWLEEEGWRGSPKAIEGWNKIRGRVPIRPTIVLGANSGGRREEQRFKAEQRKRGTQDFVEEIIGSGLIRWEKEWSGNCVTGAERDACTAAVRELIAL